MRERRYDVTCYQEDGTHIYLGVSEGKVLSLTQQYGSATWRPSGGDRRWKSGTDFEAERPVDTDQ